MQDVNFTVQKGEFVYLVGKTGTGKSSLLKSLYGEVTITEGKGFLSGNFKLTGNTSAPKINGELNFNDAGFRVTQLNSYFKVKQEKIAINNGTISFDKFSLLDENDNELFVDGDIKTPDFKAYNFNLSLSYNLKYVLRGRGQSTQKAKD